MIVVMAMLGAITRLTQSGLSITDWAPIMGVVPPLNHAAWQQAFDAYRKIPQYQVLNRGMTLHEFKGIFFWEWFHRLWGRLIGLVFALPLLWFAATRRIDKSVGFKLLGLLALGGLQCFIGWFMVESGLEVRTSVSPYRLALHLGMALLIYALMLWIALGLFGIRKMTAAKSLKRHGWAALLLLAITMCWGAFTAGLHAGEVYNTWPLMGGAILPPAGFALEPAWLNAFANPGLVQFIHRWLGPATALVILLWIWRLCRAAPDKADRCWPLALGGMAIVQVALGISTLLTHVEIVLAVTHQAGAITLLTLTLINLKRLTPRA